MKQPKAAPTKYLHKEEPVPPRSAIAADCSSLFSCATGANVSSVEAVLGAGDDKEVGCSLHPFTSLSGSAARTEGEGKSKKDEVNRSVAGSNPWCNSVTWGSANGRRPWANNESCLPPGQL